MAEVRAWLTEHTFHLLTLASVCVHIVQALVARCYRRRALDAEWRLADVAKRVRALSVWAGSKRTVLAPQYHAPRATAVDAGGGTGGDVDRHSAATISVDDFPFRPGRGSRSE